MKNKSRILAVSLIFTLLISCSVPAAESSTSMTTLTPAEPTTVPQTFTNIAPEASTAAIGTQSLTQTLTLGDYQYVMECRGEGNPTVLLLGGRAANWEPVQEALNPSTRTCLFEHAGSRPTPLTAAEIASNVHTLLNDAEITGPYVLVGFSVGGYIARLFANSYPEEVTGITLLDSSHEDQNARFLAALPAESLDECQELKDYRLELQGAHVLPIGPEITLNFDVSADDVRAIDADLGNLPVVVLTAGRSEWPECFPSEVQEQLNKTWLDLQKELANLTGNSTHLIATESGHSFAEQPEMVIDAIQQTVQASQTNAVP